MLGYFQTMMEKALSVVHTFTLGDVITLAIGDVEQGGMNVTYAIQPLRWCPCRTKCYHHTPWVPKDLGYVMCDVYQQTDGGWTKERRMVPRCEPYSAEDAGHLRPADVVNGQIRVTWRDVFKIMNVDYRSLQKLAELGCLAATMLTVTDCVILTEMLTEMHPYVFGQDDSDAEDSCIVIGRRKPGAKSEPIIVLRTSTRRRVRRQLSTLRAMFKREE